MPDAPRPNVMLDLETLGQSAGCVIVAIGAVKFGGGQILETFYERVDARSCEAAGLHAEVDAVMWWLKQPDAARLEISQEGKPLRQVLEWFAAWLADQEVQIWSNGATFDIVVLEKAYEVLKMDVPWKYMNERCYRTAVALFPSVPKVPYEGTAHNALDDAKTQAKRLMLIFDAMAKPSPPPSQ